MTKHSSRLILKISYFIIINTSELVLRNKIQFVINIDARITLVIAKLNRTYFRQRIVIEQSRYDKLS